MKTLGFQGFRWRRGWDSNPCAIARKLISSQPRYDHFDTSPYMLTRYTEINAIFSCIRIHVRTLRDAVIGRCPKTARLKAFWKIDFRLAKKISSQPRYDHFDTSPYKIVKAKPKPKLRENCEMRVFKSANAHGVNADKQRSFKDKCVTDPTMFRVSPVMTTSISLRIWLCLNFARLLQGRN